MLFQAFGFNSLSEHDFVTFLCFVRSHIGAANTFRQWAKYIQIRLCPTRKKKKKTAYGPDDTLLIEL